MLGRQPISHGQRPYPRGATGLGHHATMAADGAGAVAPAMEEQQHTGGIAAGRGRPFSRHAVEIDGIELHVGRHRPERADLVEALTALWPSDRSRLGRQQRTDGIDFVPFHQRLA